MKKIKNKQFQHLTSGLAVFASRFASLPPNFSPLGSFGFFSQNIFLFFGNIILFDLIKGGFYDGFIFVYLGFLAYYLLGKLSKDSLKKQLLFLPISSFLFFLISNFGVWFAWYPHTLQGLFKCYLLAIPFYKNTMLGDIIFGYGFFGIRCFIERSQKNNITVPIQSKLLVDLVMARIKSS